MSLEKFFASMAEIHKDAAKMALGISLGDAVLNRIAGPDHVARVTAMEGAVMGAVALGDSVPGLRLMAQGMVASTATHLLKSAHRDAVIMDRLAKFEMAVSGKSPFTTHLESMFPAANKSAEESAAVFSSATDGVKTTDNKPVSSNKPSGNKPTANKATVVQPPAAAAAKEEPAAPAAPTVPKDHAICPRCNEVKKFFKKNKRLFKKHNNLNKHPEAAVREFDGVEVCDDCFQTLGGIMNLFNMKLAHEAKTSELEVVRDSIIKMQGALQSMVNDKGEVLDGMEEMYSASNGAIKKKEAQRDQLIKEIASLAAKLGIDKQEEAPAEEPADPKALMGK